MDTMIFIIGLMNIFAIVGLILAIIMICRTINDRFDEIDKTLEKQSGLMISLSQFIRTEDLRKRTEQILFEKIQESIRSFNHRFNKVNIVDNDKPLEFPNDEK